MGRRGTSYEEGAHLRRRPVFEAHRTHETQARAQFLLKNAKNPIDFHPNSIGAAREREPGPQIQGQTRIQTDPPPKRIFWSNETQQPK